MTTTITAQADRETRRQFRFTAVTDTAGATTMDWAFGDASVQNGVALTNLSCTVTKTYATDGPFTVTATPKPSGAAGSLAGVTAATKIQPRGAWDPWSPWGTAGTVTRSVEPEAQTQEAAAPTKKATKK